MNKIIKIFSLSVFSIVVSHASSARELGDSFDDLLAKFEQTSSKASSLEATSDAIKKDAAKFRADLEQYAKDESAAKGQTPDDSKKVVSKIETASTKAVLEEDVNIQVKRRGFGSANVIEKETVQEESIVEEVKPAAPIAVKEAEPKAVTQPMNRGFRKRTPLSNLDNNTTVRQASYSSSSTMTFAEGQSESYSGYSEYGIFVIPDTLAGYCELNADDVSKDGAVTECLGDILEKRADPSNSIQAETSKIYLGAFKEAVLANISEAMDMKNTAANFDKNVLQPLEKQHADVSDLKDAVVALVATDMENSKLLNNILMMYSSKLALDSLRDFGNNEIKSNESATVLKKDK